MAPVGGETTMDAMRPRNYALALALQLQAMHACRHAPAHTRALGTQRARCGGRTAAFHEQSEHLDESNRIESNGIDDHGTSTHSCVPYFNPNNSIRRQLPTMIHTIQSNTPLVILQAIHIRLHIQEWWWLPQAPARSTAAFNNERGALG
mmetsp:Transcript_25335/g.53391  ORF Transcript_25335/g.53391 Transcript_25335/m.53391 type:complete len:149 (+) Transcript_25335:957-1403(+)|eukprot:CAMPEP_0168272124 /NCGR_PEP_ID=MMETSP0141_2-20121125/15996_1 /TAXON_ID=44445 /ORGANISM="Pseudo-nitzschia australis, Strain 10249 10 AB" /LENGTH=148 /DNA_ID=CAMNT_0008213421 /DNA_START=89 /DNA_END=535 /DNA_ORIENTATION=+